MFLISCQCKTPRKAWSDGNPNTRVLLSTVANFTIKYPISKVQFNFLRLLSTDVSQRVSYKCRSSTAWYNEHENTYKYGVRFHGWNGQRFKHKGRLSPQILRDGCQVILFQSGNLFQAPCGKTVHPCFNNIVHPCFKNFFEQWWNNNNIWHLRSLSIDESHGYV